MCSRTNACFLISKMQVSTVIQRSYIRFPSVFKPKKYTFYIRSREREEGSVGSREVHTLRETPEMALSLYI